MISIVIPAYYITDEQRRMTEDCIEHVKKYTTCKHEIILVESDIANRKSYAKAVNEGLRKATGNFIVVLNNDVTVCDKWIETMRICFYDKYCGIATLLGNEKPNEQRDEIAEDYYGPCWMIRRDVFEKVGFLDEQFKNSYEDADYWVRIYQAGYKIYRNLKRMVAHKQKATRNKVKSDNEDSDKNRELFIKKYGELDLPIYRKLRS